MKKILPLLTLMSIFSMSCLAQDLIYMKTRSVVKADVLEIHDDEIKYKKYSNLSGPTYFILLEKVNKIVYSNGYVEWFSEISEQTKNSPKQTSSRRTGYPKIKYNPRVKRSERFTIDGEYISIKEVGNYLKVNQTAYDNFGSAVAFKGLSVTSEVLFGITTLGGVLLYAITKSNTPLIVAFAGTLFYPLDLVFVSRQRKHMIKAIDTYNRGIPYSLLDKRNNITAKIGLTSNGIGLCLNF